MTKTWSAVVAALGFSIICAWVSLAGPGPELLTTKQMLIVENTVYPTKRKIIVSSIDAGIQLTEAGDPITNGATLHVYSATDASCTVLPPSATDWKLKNGQWKYSAKGVKNKAQIKDGKLIFKALQGVTFSLADDAPQDFVNAVVRFGGGTPYCLRCPGNKKDDTKKFLGTFCSAATCDPEPASCPTTTTTTSSTTTTTLEPPTTTTTTTTSTTTTTAPAGGVVLQGALTPTTGKFNYNLVLGIPGSDAACNTNFPGTHTCTYAELLTAESAGDLVGLKDIAMNTVTSFWAIDSSKPFNLQCQTLIPWDYQTADTGRFAEKVPLTNATGDLGALQSGLPAGALCLGSSWVGCCL